MPTISRMRKENINIDILITSSNNDTKNMQRK